MNKTKIFIIIDGSNFYHRLKEIKIKNILNFNYKKFASKFISKKDKLILAKYYIGAIRTEPGNKKSHELRKNQKILFNNLRKHGFEIGFGHMLKTDKYHEKGVDVLIAVDMLIGAYENFYDKIILISSDTDLIPAIIKVREKGKKIEYIGFSHKPSLGLIANSDIRRLLTKEDLEEFIK